MSVFRTVSVIFFALVHLYLFCKMYAAFGKKKWLAGVGVFFLLAVLGWFFRGAFSGTVFQTWGLSFLYTWIGFILICLPWLLLSDFCRLLCLVTDHFTGKHWARHVTSRRTLPLVLLFSLCLAVYGFWSAANPRIQFVDFPTAKLPDHAERIRIVQLSDIHLNALVKEAFLAKILGDVEKFDPDLLVITGDLVDGDMRGRDREADLLKNTRGKFGTFAVTGNHEVIVGLKQSLNFMEKAQLRVLRGERLEAAGIEIIGVDDSAVRQRGHAKTPGLSELLGGKKSDKFLLVLSHKPDVDPETTGLYDLQLAGHTHNGQIWPGNLIVRYLFGAPAPGLSRYEGKNGASTLYLSSGTGFWGPPMRLWARPEITVIDLVRP